MLKKIKDTAAMMDDNGEKPQCYVLFILSHGNTVNGEEGPFGTDGKHLTKNRILMELDSCRNLNGVPRLVFLQCCRGSQLKSLLFL